MNRGDYEQQWNFDPAQTIPAEAPQPWYVAGYSWKAVDNVMRVDYLAHRRCDLRTVYEVPGGRIEYIGHPVELRGRPHGVGTLFVLWGDSTTLVRIVDEAMTRVGGIRELPAGAAEV